MTWNKIIDCSRRIWIVLNVYIHVAWLLFSMGGCKTKNKYIIIPSKYWKYHIAGLWLVFFFSGINGCALSSKTLMLKNLTKKSDKQNTEMWWLCLFICETRIEVFFFSLLVFIKLPFGLLNFIQNKISKLASNGKGQ